MASYSGGTPIIGGAQWNGNQQLATRRQLLSSIAGLYADIQDIELSSISVTNLDVSTLTAYQWISTPELYVSSIIGGGLQVNNGLLQISTGNISLVSLSTLQFKGFDLGGVSFNFDLGLGNAIGGFLGGLGALVGGAFIGLGTGTGIAIQGITNGLFSLANTQGGTQINNNVFETINGTTQLQISTLGDEFPYYSSIFRQVSSLSPNSIPGQEIFLSTIFPAGTTCVRSVSDPVPILTNNSNINTSTIQSFGQWVPFLDPSVTGEDIFARNATFSTLVVNPPQSQYGSAVFASNVTGDVAYYGTANGLPNTISYPVTSNNSFIAAAPATYYPHYQIFFPDITIDFISTAYNQYTSSIGNVAGGVFFIQSTITSNLSTIPKFTYVGTQIGGGNFVTCEPDETSFLSTGTMDFVAQNSNIFLQWGFAADNLNSTIAVGTSKRVTWNINSNTSNFINIPVPASTIVDNMATVYSVQCDPLQAQVNVIASPDTGLGGQGGMAFNISRAVFGGANVFDNIPSYPYQFNNNVYVNGTLEADTLIATSSILAVSTNIQTFFSTQTFEADVADIGIGNISTLNNIFFSSFTIDNFRIFSLFSFISTMYVDFQIVAEDNATCYLQKIIGSNTAFIDTYKGTFDILSTNVIQASNTLLTPFVNCFGISSVNNSTTNLRTNTLFANTLSNNTFFTNQASISTLTTNNAVFGTANIGGGTAQFSTATISSMVFSSLEGINLSSSNITISTLNNQNTNTLLQYLATPNSDFATLGSPGTWLSWFDIGFVSSSILSCPSFDINLGTIAMGADNPPNGGMTGYLGVREKGQGNPITYKVFENRTIYAGDSALYGGDVTLALRKGIDYSVNASTLSVYVFGAANNPYFRIGGYASNCFIRGFPY